MNLLKAVFSARQVSRRSALAALKPAQVLSPLLRMTHLDCPCAGLLSCGLVAVTPQLNRLGCGVILPDVRGFTLGHAVQPHHVGDMPIASM
jgi:hypothetical protein